MEFVQEFHCNDGGTTEFIDGAGQTYGGLGLHCMMNPPHHVELALEIKLILQ